MRRNAALTRGLLLCVLLIAVSGAAVAQSGPAQSAVATLKEGPERRRGIEQFAPDLTPYWFGLYQLPSGSVTVRYTEEPLSATADWASAPCDARPLVTDGARSYRYTASDGSWSLLLTTDGAFDLCGFVDRFVTRFQFFQGIESRVSPGGPPAFPAVVELP